MRPEYLALFLLLLAAAGIDLLGRDRRRFLLVYGLAVTALVLLAGLRGAGVDRDYEVFRDFFDSAPALGPGFLQARIDAGLLRVEPGWVALNSLFKGLGCSYEAFVLAVAAATIGLNAAFFWRQARLPAMALLIYYSHAFLTREMLQMRFGLACALSLWALCAVAGRRYRKAFLLTVLAVLMHMTALIVLLPIAVHRLGWRLSWPRLLLLAGAAVLMSLLINDGIPVLGEIERMTSYLNTELSYRLGVFSNPVTIKQVALAGLMWKVISEKGPGEVGPATLILFQAYLIGTLWIIAFSNLGIIAARGAAMLSVAEPCFLAELAAHGFAARSWRGLRWGVLGGTLALCVLMFTANIYVKETVAAYHPFWVRAR